MITGREKTESQCSCDGTVYKGILVEPHERDRLVELNVTSKNLKSINDTQYYYYVWLDCGSYNYL